MSKHTPGPWKVLKTKNPIGRLVIGVVSSEDEIPFWVANASLHRDCSPLQASANAKLIAAAPEMLEALQDAHDALVIGEAKMTDEAIKKLQSLLARVKGNTWE